MSGRKYHQYLANTVGNWCEKIVAQDLGEQGQLWHELSFTGWKARGAIDSVMLMDEIRRKTALRIGRT